MPNRIIREGILTSDYVNNLTWGAEVFYRRLMSVADDYGRYDGRIAILRSSLYGLKIAKVTESDIAGWLAECLTENLILYYKDKDKPFIELQKFNQQQRSNSKWPAPPNDSNCAQMISVAHLGAGAFVSVCVSGAEGAPPRGEAKKREADPVWDEVIKLWYEGKTPESSSLKKAVGAIVRDFKGLSARDVDIRERLKRYKERWPNMTASAQALIKHWAEFSPKRAEEIKDQMIRDYAGLT